MKYLFITQVWPRQSKENNMYSDLVRVICNHGHEVTVLVINEKRNNEPTRMEYINGLRVLKVKCGNIQKTNKYTKVISSLTAGPKLWHACRHHLKTEKYDCVIWALSTMLIENYVMKIKKYFGAKLYLLLKEYWPDDPADLGAMRKDGAVYKIFSYIEKRMLRGADYIGVCSEAGLEYVKRRLPKTNVAAEVCPNCEISRTSDKNRNVVRKKYSVPQNSVLFIFGGNLGLSQGIDDMIAEIKEASVNEKAFFLILGSGTEYKRVEKKLNGYNGRVSVLPAVSYSEFYDICHAADIGMLFLFRNYSVPNIPGKFTTYLNSGLPVLGAIDKTTDVGSILEEYNCGFSCLNGDTAEFVKLVDKIVADTETLKDMSVNAKKLFEKKYSAEVCAEIIESHFKQ